MARTQALYLGASPRGWVWGPAEGHVLVLGPPRSGKTSSLVVPNVLAADGPVVATSTKRDVLAATLPRRQALGRCWLFDPTGEVRPPEGVTPLRWSPVAASVRWDTARRMARGLVATSASGRGVVDGDHWQGRARAVVGPLLHAAALAGGTIEDVARWVHRRETGPAEDILAREGSRLAADVLAGVTRSEDRELSAIFSTASQALAAYQSEAALAAAREPNFDPGAFVASADAVYVCAPSRAQALVAPLVVALVEEISLAAYRVADTGGEGHRAGPVVLALDEAANIAPLPSLPSIVSEGGGQGVLVLACFQDLSQARARWGPDAADGFLSHFRAKVILPGLGETRTLEALSRLCGDVEVPVRSVARTGRWWQRRGVATTTTWSTRRQRRVPVATLGRGSPGRAVYLEAGCGPAQLRLTPCHEARPWVEVVAGEVGRARGGRRVPEPPGRRLPGRER